VKIAVFGSGAVGGYFGARLAAAGSRVSLVARGESVAAMREHGLRLESPFGDVHLRPDAFAVTEGPASIGPSDIVLFTVKSYDTDTAARRLAPLLHAGTGVISLQNGIENEAKIAAEGAALPDDLVDRQLEFAASLEPFGRSSMYDDMVGGRPMELEALLGEVVRRAAQNGVAAPVSEMLYGVLLPTARDPARARSTSATPAGVGQDG
jgi:ketopantoate reductase